MVRGLYAYFTSNWCAGKIIKKQFPSAFSNPDFEPFLAKANIESIYVVGVDGGCCVSITVMDDLDRGIRINLLMDAIEAHSDKFYYKDLKNMELKGAKVLMNLEEL